MRAVFVADIHAHPYRDNSLDGGEDRLRHGLGAVQQSLQVAEARGCVWVSLGDIKLLFGLWPQAALNGLLDAMRRTPRVRKYLLPGNGGHDGLGTKMSGVDGYDPFLPYATVIGGPQVLPVDGEPVAWWPWHPPRLVEEALPPFLDEARAAGARILCGHGFLLGSRVGPSEVKLHVGHTLGDFGLAGIRSVRVFNWGFFGDVHHGQMLGDAKRRRSAAVYYPGSPYAQNWGERERVKGCLYADTATGEVELVALDAPHFVVVDAEALRDTDPATLRGQFVRVMAPGEVSAAQREEWQQRFEPRVLDIHLRPTQVSASGQRRSAAHGAMTHEQLVEEYVSAVPPPEGATRAGVVRAGKTLLQIETLLRGVKC